MNVIFPHIGHEISQFIQILSGRSRWVLVGLGIVFWLGAPSLIHAKVTMEPMTKERAIQLGEDFGLIVGEVDEEIRALLGLEEAKGVVVFEVLGGKPADLAGIKPRALIKEVNSVEISTLEDFGQALKEALRTENFSLATYEPYGLEDQGMSGGINFHFVRIEKV